MKKIINELRLRVIRFGLAKRYHNQITLGENFRVRRAFNVTLKRNGHLDIGNDVSFNNGCSINVLGKVSIGNHVMIGEGVKIYDHNHRFRKCAKTFDAQDLSIGSVHIGNNCWIGSNVVVLKDSYISDNCVVGAGCVVSGYIPEWTLLKNNRNYTMETIKGSE